MRMPWQKCNTTERNRGKNTQFTNGIMMKSEWETVDYRRELIAHSSRFPAAHWLIDIQSKIKFFGCRFIFPLYNRHLSSLVNATISVRLFRAHFRRRLKEFHADKPDIVYEIIRIVVHREGIINLNWITAKCNSNRNLNISIKHFELRLFRKHTADDQNDKIGDNMNST